MGLLISHVNGNIEITEKEQLIYKFIASSLKNAAEKHPHRLIIDLKNKHSLVRDNTGVINDASENFEQAGDVLKAYKKSRIRSITLLTDNYTLTAYENFPMFKNNLTVIRKFLCSSDQSPIMKIKGRSVKIHVRNIALLTGDKELSAWADNPEGLLQKTEKTHEYAISMENLRIKLSRRAGIPLTISSMGGEYVKTI